MTIPTVDPDDTRQCYCGNCNWTGLANQLGRNLMCTNDLSERLEPGEEVPIGTCPECGALCYINKNEPLTHILSGQYGFGDDMTVDKMTEIIENDVSGYYFNEGEAVVRTKSGKFMGFKIEVKPIEYTDADMENALGEDRFEELKEELADE